MDITWIKNDDDEFKDYSLQDLFALVKEKSSNIANAVSELETLIAEIKE